MRNFLILLALLCCTRLLPVSYVYGTIFIQTRFDQPRSQMQKFNMAYIYAKGSNGAFSPQGNFKLTFQDFNPNTDVYLELPEDKLTLNGVAYEVVNYDIQNTHTVFQDNQKTHVNIVVCKKGDREKFTEQLVMARWGELFKEAKNDPKKQEMIKDFASILYAMDYDKAVSVEAPLSKNLIRGHFDNAVKMMGPYAEIGFAYLEKVRKDPMRNHPQLREIYVKNIHTAAYLHMLNLESKKSLQLYQRLYSLDSLNVETITKYAWIKKYVEQYGDALAILKRGRLVPLNALEKATINSELGSLYQLLNFSDTARFYYLESLAELDKLGNRSALASEKKVELYLAVAMTFGSDSALYYRRKVLSECSNLIDLLKDYRQAESNFGFHLDTAKIYFIRFLAYEDLNQPDSMELFHEKAVAWLKKRNTNGRFDHRLNLYESARKRSADYMEMLAHIKEFRAEAEKNPYPGNEYERAKTWDNLVTMYTQVEKYDLAREAARKALAIYDSVGKMDFVFRGLRTDKAFLYLHLSSLIADHAADPEMDSCLVYDKRALEELLSVRGYARDSHSADILLLAKNALSHFSEYSGNQRLLLIRDQRLQENKLFLDSILRICETIHQRNRETHPKMIACYLYGMWIYGTNDETKPRAVEYARKAYKLMNEHRWLREGRIFEAGINKLNREAAYPENTATLLAYMYWNIDSLKLAAERFRDLLDYPRRYARYGAQGAALQLERGDLTLALKQAKGACDNRIFMSKRFPGPLNQALFVAAASSYSLGQPDKALVYVNELSERELSNFRYYPEALLTGMKSANQCEQFEKTISFFKSYESLTKEAALSHRFEYAWALTCMGKVEDAKTEIVKITGTEPNTLKTNDHLRLLALCHVLLNSHDEASRESFYETLVSQRKDKDLMINFLLHCTYLALKANKNEMAEADLKRLKNLLKKTDNELLKAEYLILKGMILIKAGDKPSGRQQINDAESIYLRYKDTHAFRHAQILKLLNENK